MECSLRSRHFIRSLLNARYLGGFSYGRDIAASVKPVILMV